MLGNQKVLIVDDEESIHASIMGIFSDTPLQFLTATDGREGLKKFSEFQPDLIVLDYQMPNMNGIEFIRAARSIHANVPVIVMTAHGDKEISVQFLKEGAFRYLEKPFDIEEFRLTVVGAIEHANLQAENEKLQSIIHLDDRFPEIVGESDAMKGLFELVNKVSETDVTVLIQGESGTGKELIAKAIHERSPLKDGPFIRFNCAALPEGLVESELFGYEKGAFTGADQQKPGRFELAENGTLFLDEIGEVNLNVQAKLLRILQEKEFERLGGTTTLSANVRIVAATNRDLGRLAEEKAFREDLFYRLSAFPLLIPPLRDRGDDVVLIAEYFLATLAKRYNKSIHGLSDEARQKLRAYEWKGNVRELENVISRAIILCSGDVLGGDELHINGTSNAAIRADLSDAGVSSLLEAAFQEKYSEDALVKSYAKYVLTQLDNSKKDTAEFLDINYRTLMGRIS